jgi:hypothetical protein
VSSRWLDGWCTRTRVGDGAFHFIPHACSLALFFLWLPWRWRRCEKFCHSLLVELYIQPPAHCWLFMCNSVRNWTSDCWKKMHIYVLRSKLLYVSMLMLWVAQ